MADTDPYRHDQTMAYDYLRVDAFIKNLIDARTLATAFELGVIDYLIENQDSTFDNLKSKFECDVQGVRLLLDLLMTNRVVEECDGEIKLSQQFLKALQYRDLLEVKLEFANLVVSDFTDLFTVLIKRPDRFGRNARVFDLFNYNRCFHYSPENYERTKRWMRITTSLTRYEAQVCMKHHDFSRYRRILDIGGNSGEFVLQICKKCPGILSTVFDLPLVCDIGREHVCHEPEAEKITFIKGNALADVLPEGFDLITFKSILHDWPEKEAKQLILKAGQSLEPGGTLLIFERGPIEPGKTSLPYSMIPFLLFFRFFRSPTVYEKQLKQLGFQDIQVQKIDLEMPFFLVAATKRI